MAEPAISRPKLGGIGAILATGDRHFLVRNSGEQVKICSIEADTVALYFSASWCPPCRLFTPKLIQTYQEQLELQQQGNNNGRRRLDLEIVLVSRDRDEDSFAAYFAKMPPTWLAVPFSDTDHITRLVSRFKVTSIPCLVILGAETGEIYTKDGVRLVAEHGVAASPFTPHRIGELKQLERAARENQTIHSVLATPARDYLISSSSRAGEKEKVLISELEGKYVALFFTATPMVEFTAKLAAMYEKLRDVGEKFEVVFVYFSCDESVFQQSFFAESMPPWLAIPHGDPTCDRLVRYFDLRAVPTLVLLGPDGKTVNGNLADLVEEHGVEAWEGFPFDDSDEKMECLKRRSVARAATQTLESLLVQGDLDYVIRNGKDGATKVPVSDLVGKTVLLYFSAKWCPPCRAFLPTLVKEYGKMKERSSSDDDDFEMVFVSLDRDQSSFDDYFSAMPWLALPFDDARKEQLMRRFRVRSLPWLVAVGPSGVTLTADAVAHVVAHGADAFPFTEELIGELERELDEEAMASWPEKVMMRHLHLHELELTRRDAAAGTYTCDGCEEVGSKWAYRCDQCDFDLHPKCAWELGEKEKEEEEEEEEGKAEPAGIVEELPAAAYVCEGGACTKTKA